STRHLHPRRRHLSADDLVVVERDVAAPRPLDVARLLDLRRLRIPAQQAARAWAVIKRPQRAQKRFLERSKFLFLRFFVFFVVTPDLLALIDESSARLSCLALSDCFSRSQVH